MIGYNAPRVTRFSSSTRLLLPQLPRHHSPDERPSAPLTTRHATFTAYLRHSKASATGPSANAGRYSRPTMRSVVATISTMNVGE